MTAVQLNRTFLKKPLYTVYLLVGLVLLIEGLSWTIAFSAKLKMLEKHGGPLEYIGMFFRGNIPEICTAYILATLLNQHHKYFNLNSVELTPRSISLYELHLLPTLLASFLFFNPVTETVRFLLEQFPNYSFSYYWETYLAGTFTFEIYFRYLIPVLLIGYLATNISFISDYFKQRQEEQEAAEAQAAEASSQAALALSAAFLAKPVSTPSPYLPHLKGKNAFGELDFPVTDVYFFTIEERSYYAELAKGRYAVAKTLNELEAELDPGRFFRIKRDYIVNRLAVLNYAYWENGKYIVRLNTPDRYEIVVPRARMQVFREWLQETGQPLPDETSSDSYSVNA